MPPNAIQVRAATAPDVLTEMSALRLTVRP